MNRGRRRKLLYLLAAVWLLVGGVCVDCSQAYSVLAYPDTYGDAECSLDSSNGLASDVICTSDLLGQWTVVRDARTLRSFGSRARSGLRIASSIPVCLNRLSRFSIGMRSRTRQCEVHSRTVILRYIHNKDGRKSRPVFRALS